ncbi:MAG: type II secretion system protein [Armatimonadetes bacterium]|nr:type II secretion system protein [Armatimonadota bacterium]
MRSRKAFTLVEIMIVVLIIGVILTIAVPGWMRIRLKSQETNCAKQRKALDDAKQYWAQDTGQSAGATPTMADIVPTYLKREPKCPGSGTYTLGAFDADTDCSVHGH